MDTAHSAGVNLPFDIEGEGPDLVLVPGVASTRPLWNLVRPQLAARFRTIAFDCRDSSASTASPSAYGMRELVGDAITVMDAAGSTRAHVLGHSLGGAVAQELALAHPDRVASLTLVSTWSRGDAYAGNVARLMRDLTDHIDEDRSFLAALLYIGCGETTLRNADIFAMTDAALALGPPAPRAAIARQWDFVTRVDTLDRLPQIAVPVHVVWGTEDRLLPPWLSKQLAAAISHARSSAIEGCGHLPMIAAPEAFVAAVTEFLASL
ncbi:MAG TPA: alpha/beta hydrolase [Candidatus Baltobacteraceae bacterium]|jgi:pimeloyl-ACP methyl ester carboxylesterase|nr:alpha/beta hydrolase [Candidatus Baltobacteraceae bacterium]